MFKDEVLDRLDVAIRKTNETLAASPLAGKIITIETDLLPIGTDTNATVWQEDGEDNPQFIYRLRIFYITGPAAFETIGVADITPTMFGEGVYEPFPQVLAKAYQWVAAQPPDFNLLNVQTLFFKAKGDNDTLKMSYNESDLKMYFVKYLRLAYAISHLPVVDVPRGNINIRNI